MKTLLPALLLIPLLAWASENKGIEAKRQACLRRASITNEMKQCEYNAFHEASAKLNALQAAIKESLKKSDVDGEIERRFNASNSAWVSLRDAQCRFKSAELLHGSEESLLLASCSVNMTLERIKELQTARL